jgi:hypothetical protein
LSRFVLAHKPRQIGFAERARRLRQRSTDREQGDAVALSAFDDKSQEPTKPDLKGVLGRSCASWDELVAYIDAKFSPLELTWGFSGAKWGWALRLKQKKRTVLYMTPCNRHFVVGFALGEKAVRAAHALTLPSALLAAIDAAPKYAEGRGVRIEVRTKKDVDAIKRLAAVKMAN